MEHAAVENGVVAENEVVVMDWVAEVLLMVLLLLLLWYWVVVLPMLAAVGGRMVLGWKRGENEQ